ncbi:Hypothetical predicted protein [Paramuricea clavata]|uniref:Uncharacterized protein n=1 Tax=Paramuricea clavata TaxID=317549 RepID=A0A6S7HRZ1_PARCT|nr:Hypothetical predicted protein [Paramuricea clavata]
MSTTKPEKRSSLPPLVIRCPDPTQIRYQVDEFKQSKMKSIPYEKLNFSIYKQSANMVALCTCEERILSWIRALYFRYFLGLENSDIIKTRWEEQECDDEASKCVKIILNLSFRKKSIHENLVTITIYTTLGRIHVQGNGRFLQEWGNKEFKSLLTMINATDNIDQCNSTHNLQNYIDDMMNLKDIVKLSDLSTETNYVSSNNTINVEVNKIPATPKQPAILTEPVNQAESPREKTFSFVKSNLAHLESDFIDFKQTMSKSLEQKNEELKILQDKLIMMESKETNMQQIIGDLTLKQYAQDEEIKKLKSHTKNQQHEYRNLQKKLNNLSERIKTNDPSTSTELTSLSPP